MTGPEFHPGAVYRINIDTDGDNHADVAFTFVFSEYRNGTQTGTAWYATGAQARQPEPVGEVLTESLPVSFDGTAQPVQAGRIRLFAGLRSDPFFADVEGALQDSSGPGTTISPTTTSTPSRWRYPTTSSAARPSASGPRSACAATARWCRWTAAGTRPSTRSSTPTGRKTSTTPGSPPTT